MERDATLLRYLAPLKRIYRRTFWFILSCIFLTVLIGFYSIQLYIQTIQYYNPHIPSKFTQNYFRSSKDIADLGYIIHTPTCSILNVSAWDETILPILYGEDMPPPDCGALEPRRWTFTNNTNLVINETGLKESGYSLSSVSCCYYSIFRVAQSLSGYDSNADSKIRYSSECTVIKQLITPMDTPFIRVHCTAKYWPFSSDVLYRRFHAVALLPKTSPVTEKVKHWESSHAKGTPPNVLMLGIDSMSRLSFHRTMPQTCKVLEELGAVEMYGYTKVGENTFPNWVAALSGYSEAEMRQNCLLSNEVAQDDCVRYYLWRRFSSAKYLTAFIEDAPLLAAFNYLKTGFVEEPTDVYFRQYQYSDIFNRTERYTERLDKVLELSVDLVPFFCSDVQGVHFTTCKKPFMVAVSQHTPTTRMTLSCLGHESVEQVVLRYIDDLVTAFRTHKKTNLPYFLFSWFTSLAHENLMNAKYSDDIYAQFLKKVQLNHTILLFLSDHGYRFGSIRQTFPGWYEEKLPNLWIYLPHSLRKSHKHWLSSLQENARKLTSTFDLFSTLSHVLDEFSQAPPLPHLMDRLTQKNILRQYGRSLFTKVPSRRKCSEAGIDHSLCACIVPKRLSTNNTHIQIGAETAVAYINSLLPSQCAQLQLLGIDAAAQIDNGEESAKTKTFVVAFQTSPGQFMFEATIIFTADDKLADFGLYSVSSDVLRMNKISTDVSCVHDQVLEKLCYCGSS